MATEQPQAQPKPRVPFAASVSNRADLPDVDARLINGYLEKQEDKSLHAYRRPGTGLFHNFDTAGLGRGIYNWNGDVYAIYGTQVFKNFVQIGTVSLNTGKIFSFTPILGLTPRLFFHDGTSFYNWDNVNLVTLVASHVVTTTGNITAGSPVVTGLSTTVGLGVNTNAVGNAGIPDGSFILTVDSGSQVTLNAPATGGFTGVTFTFTVPGIPSEAVVPGVAYLDATAYILTRSAKIFGSNINDTSTEGWDSINFLTAQIEPDRGVAIAKQLVYVVAFKEWSTEFFYDAGNPTGSPLHNVQGNKISQGCRDAGTVATLEGDLLWVSTTREGNVDVQFMTAAKASPVGTPAIERLLQAATFTGCYSFGFHISGHKFYILTLPAADLTLVFDVTTREWYRWTDVNGHYLPYTSATYGANQQVLLQHESNGKMYQLSSTLTTDDGAIIPWDLYTPNFDGGARTKKTLTRMDFISDQTPGTILEVSHSDDDYKTWSSFRFVDLGKKRPNLRDCGTYRRRAWHFKNRTPTFLRIQFAELHLSVGTN